MHTVGAVAIIGAGPYGLSVAAHLTALGLTPLVFGPPMETWRLGMPNGMRLKSEGFASNLSDPGGQFTLKTFCLEEGLPYADLDLAVPVETFAAYGAAFQKRFVPQLDTRLVRTVRRTSDGFVVELEDGSCVPVARVILATGLRPHRHVPPALAGLPADRVSHSGDQADYTAFSGRRVVVVGAGASAVDAAAALQRAGASVHLVSRRASVRFYAPRPRRPVDRVLAPITPLGPGWKKVLCVKAPLLFRLLPERIRMAIVRRYLGPAPGWSARDHFEGKVAVTLSSTIVGARETREGVDLIVGGPDGRRTTLSADHVIAGTGYDIDVRTLPFLDAAVAGDLALTGAAPRLSAHFESSIPGLYFVGTAAAFSFGPMLRFVCGAGFAARRVARHVARAEAHAGHPAPRSRQPRLLFLTLLNDVGSDRIVAAMGSLGCECAVLGPPQAFAARSRFATAFYRLPRFGGSWLRSLVLKARLGEISRAWKPDLVIPLDDFSARQLRGERLRRTATPAVRHLIERSFGDPKTYATICSREAVVAAAEALGLRTPRQTTVATLEAARRAAAAFGYPVVLKREQTCGGFGVAIVETEADLARAFQSARRKAGLKRAAQTLLGLGTADQSALVLQSYVPGSMAFRVVACADGEVLDGISFSAESINPPVTGASTVLRAIDRPDLDEATRRLAARLGCSGLIALDFILSSDGATLIEVNPRPVTSGHLGRLYGHDIYAALVAHWRGEPIARPVGLEAGPRTVALFPRELDRDPSSPLLERPSEALHDVPWSDPGVLAPYARWLQRRHPRHERSLERRLALAHNRASGPRPYPARDYHLSKVGG